MKVLFLLLPAALIWGCTRTLYLPAVSESTTRAATVRTDTLYVRDSIRVEPRGDTVYHTRERLVYRTAAVHDTLTVERVDTVTVVPSDVDSDSRGSSGSRRSANLWRTVACIAAAIAALLLLLLRFLRR